MVILSPENNNYVGILTTFKRFMIEKGPRY